MLTLEVGVGSPTAVRRRAHDEGTFIRPAGCEFEAAVDLSVHCNHDDSSPDQKTGPHDSSTVKK